MEGDVFMIERVVGQWRRSFKSIEVEHLSIHASGIGLDMGISYIVAVVVQKHKDMLLYDQRIYHRAISRYFHHYLAANRINRAYHSGHDIIFAATVTRNTGLTG